MEGIKYLLSELMEPHGRGGGKSVRQRDGGNQEKKTL